MLQTTSKLYELTQVLPFVHKGQVLLDGEVVKTGRFLVFLKKGTKCVSCGLQATFFRKEKTIETTILNLYGIRDNKMIMFTRDHIIPISRGGTGDLSNIQPMCIECNGKKADYISFPNRVIETGKVIVRLFHIIYVRTKAAARTLKSIWRK